MLPQQQQYVSGSLSQLHTTTSSSINSWLDIQNKISESFDNFISDFQLHIDFYFKTYNKNLKENIEMQIKASKKERTKYMQFLNHEEKIYWKEFPRRKHFYHANLRKIYQLFQQGRSQNSQRDISLIVSGFLNMMPIASKKYCKKFDLEPIFHQDLENKNTFDTLTESMKMFDSDDLCNWRILGFTVSLLVSDCIQVLLDQLSNERDIKISSGVIDILLDICKYFTSIMSFQQEINGQFNTNFREEGIEEESIFDLYYKQLQVNWAKLFGNLSKLHFDKCMKFMMISLQQDFRKLREEEIEQHAQKIHFCRFLQIRPTDKLMASHVQILFDNFLTIMSSKSITQQMKNVLIITLKYLIEQLNFSGQDFNFDSPMGILWPAIEGVFKLAVKYTKKEFYKDYAYQLLVGIIKIGPNDFYNQNLQKLLKREKIQNYFENKKSYNQGTNLMVELSLGTPLITNKYSDWKPKIHSNSFILIDNAALGILLPMKSFKRTYRFRLARKMSSNDNLPFSYKESFKYIFNTKLITEINQVHVQYMRQMLFEDLEFFVSYALPFLLGFLKSQERYDLPILGLKIADYALNPIHNFKNEYLRIQPQNSRYLKEQLVKLQSYISIVLKEILRSQVLHSEFLNDIQSFYKSDDKELCNDQMSIIWPKSSQSLYMNGKQLSQVLKQRGVAKFYLAEAKRCISFEDFRELQKLEQNEMDENQDIEYIQDQFNQISQVLIKEQKDWDYQKEKFMRYRIQSFLSEERKEGQRQNTIQFTTSDQKMEEIKLVKKVLKMITYLPEVQDYFKFYPSKRLLVEEGASIINKVAELNFIDYEDSSPMTSGQTQGGDDFRSAATIGLQGNLKKKKSDPKFQQKQLNPKFREVQSTLPYFILNLNYDISSKSQKYIQKLMVYGDFKMRLALVDQMIYFIKELMLDSPEEFLINQFLQLLISLIKIWHQSEKNKIQVKDNVNIQNGRLEGIDILNLNLSSNTYIEGQNLNMSEIQHEINQHQYIFDMIDTISLLGICNRDRLVRQLCTILIVECGKMKRLLVRKDNYKKSLYDLIEYNQDKIKKAIVEMSMVFNSFKQLDFKTYSEMENIINDLSLYQLMIDNFDYKKAGLTEGQVKDFQIIMIGELSRAWKSTLLQESQYSCQILNFVNILCSRTLHLFENKQDNTGINMTLVKDYVGINLLLAITLYNVTNTQFNHSKKSDPDYDESSCPTQQVLSTNSIFEDIQSLLVLLELDFSDLYKTAFGKFYPQKFNISQIVISFVYQLQVPKEQQSYDTLTEMFQLDKQESKSSSYYKNCQIVFVLLSLNVDLLTQYCQDDINNLKDLAYKLKFFPFKYIGIMDATQKKQSLILFLNYFHSLITVIKRIYSKKEYKYISKLISSQYQYDVLIFLQNELNLIQSENLEDMKHLEVKIREVWSILLSFENIFDELPNIKLDLKFLIELEKEGYKVLKYYKYLHNNNNPSQLRGQREQSMQEEAQQDFSVNELKFLLNQVYQYYSTQGNIQELLMKSNTYYKCFINNIVGADQLLNFLSQKNFNQVYGQITSSCIRSSKVLIETKIKKFISYGLHQKYFLVGLFMSLNSMDKKVIEKSKVLCLSILPLMFEDEKFRELVEYNIQEQQDIRSLVAFDNKNFYRFIKQIFKDEETYNMKHHFEKYFSISGLLRNTLNEIIKLQQLNFAESMLLKVLDIVTYFIGNLQLRRAPQVEQNSFIFDNLIDYKSFEFLSKLYKISERLVDYDDESIIMNMWYKVVEGKMSNFEILAKFLVHNLSSYLLKLKAQNKKAAINTNNQGKKVQSEYSIDFEKQKRYAISIFNYIKARTAQMDLRNSIQVQQNSVTWSQKMIRLLSRVSLNIHSKYVLEKIKLKKILQEIHKEINESGVKLQLKGGLDHNFEVVRQGNIRMSVNISQLLQSQTFLETFAARNRKEKCIMKNLMFRIRKIMLEKYEEVSSQDTKEQMQSLIIKYLENTLVFITNDVERPTQVITFSIKEQLSVVIIMIVLAVDLIINEKNENRFYFLLETFNKLSINISSVQKYFNFKQFTTQTIYSKELKVMDKIWSIINLKDCIDNFNIFTKILFKQLQNLYCCPYLQYYLLQMWQNSLLKNRDAIFSRQQQVQSSINEMQVMKLTQSMMYSRQLVMNILQSSFFTLFEFSQQRFEVKEDYKKYITINFIQHVNSLLDFILPSNQQKLQQIKGQNDPEQTHIAFSNNAIFWLAFSCLECASISQDESMNILQAIGIKALRRILEESDFLKMLIGVSKLSPHFYAYNLAIQRNQASLLSLIFNSLENPNSAEDAMKSMIVTIRVQDYKLLCSQEDKDLCEVELQRFLLLVPFLWQQFTYILQGKSDSSQQIFTNYRSIVQLLKKSLPSIGIDKKKDIFDKLDTIQREAEKNEEKLIKKEFEGLIFQTVALCHQMQFDMIIFDVEKYLLEMRKSKTVIIDKQKIDLVIKIINEFIVNNEISLPDSQPTFKELMAKNLMEKVYFGEILGEEVANVKQEMRPLYFGLKNIILKEVENIDKDIDIKKFFFDGSSHQIHKSHGITPIQELQAESQSDLGSVLNDANFTNVLTKISQKKQEATSKYQNSQPVSAIKQSYNPSERKITQISGSQSDQRRIGSATPYQQQYENVDQIGGHSPTSKLRSFNQQYKSKYQNQQDDQFNKSPANKSVSKQIKEQQIFQDDDIHVPSSSFQQNAKLQRQSSNDQQDPLEIVFNDRDDDSEFNVQYENEDEDEEDFSGKGLEKKNQQKQQKLPIARNFDDEPAINSSSSEDPREKLKKVIESQRQNMPQRNISPSKYQKQEYQKPQKQLGSQIVKAQSFNMLPQKTQDNSTSLENSP